MKKLFQIKLITWIASMVFGRVYAEWRALFNRIQLCLELAGLKTRIPLIYILPQHKEVAGVKDMENKEGKKTIGSDFPERHQEKTPKYNRRPVVLTFIIAVNIWVVCPVQKAVAAITNLQVWNNVYHNAARPGASAASFAVISGTNRMLVVALTYNTSDANETLTVTSVSYGGTTMTPTINDASTSSRMHTLIYFLKDTPSVMDGTSKILAVSITGSGAALMQDIYYSVYAGVDQSATPIRDTKNYNTGTATTQPTVFGTALTVNLGDQAVVIYNSYNNNATGIPSLTLNDANITPVSVQSQTWGGAGAKGGRSLVGYRSIPGSNTSTTASATASPASRMSMSGISIKAYIPGAADAAQSILTPTSASITANGSSTQVLTVQAKDALGVNLTTGGSTVAITKSTGNGTIGTVTDNSNGTYTATVTSPTATGSGVFVASLGGAAVKSGTGSQTQSTISYTPGALHHFSFSLSGPQCNGNSFSGTNTLTALDANNNTITTFNALTDNVTISADLPLSGTISGLSGGNKLSSGSDFVSGVANLSNLGLTYTGTAATGTFTATSVSSKTGTSMSVTITAPGTWLGTTSSAWENASNWCGGVPTSSTAVIIPTSAPNWPTLSTGITGNCSSLTFGGATSTLNFTGGNLTVAGNVAFSSGVITSTTSPSTLAVGGIWTGSGTTFTPATYLTVNFNGASQTIPQLASNYYNLTLSGSGTKTIGITTGTIGGDFTLSENVTANSGGVQGDRLTVTGNLSLSGTSTLNMNNNSQGLTVNGNVSSGAGTNFNLNNGTSNSISGNFNIDGTFTRSDANSSGSLDITGATTINNGGSVAINTVLTLTFNGLLTVNSGGTYTRSSTTDTHFKGGITNSGTFTAGSGNYIFQNNSQALTGTLSIPNISVTGVTVTNNNILTVGTALDGTGTLVQAAGSTLNIGGTSTISTLIATASGNTVNYTGAAQEVKTTTYYNLNLSGSDNKTIANGTTINNNLSVSGSTKGLLSDGGTSSTLSLSLGGTNQAIGSYGSSSSSATFKKDTWFVAPYTGILNANSGCTAGTWNGTTSTDWNTASNWCGGIPTSTTNVVINAGGNQPIIGTSGGVCHDLTLGSGASLTIDDSNTLAVSGSWSNNGNFTKNSSTVTLNGTNSTQTLTGATTFNNLTIDHSGTGEVYAAGSTLKVVGLCYVKTGKLISSSDYASVQIDAGSTLECIANGTLQVSTSWSNNGTFIAGTNGTVEFAGTTTTIQPGTGINSFYNILITTGLTVSSANINVAGNFTNNGIFTHSNGTVTFNGSSTIYGSTANNSFYNVIITGSLTVPNANLNIARDFTNNGTFIHNSGTITLNGGGTAQHLGGMSGSTFNNLVVTSSSHVETNGTGAGILTTVSGNLTISSGSLTVNPTNQLTVSGTLTNNATTTALVLKSDANGTASLIHNTSNVPATVERYISNDAEKWHFLSSPVAAQAISGDWLPSGTYGNGTGYDLYLWNEPTKCWIYKLNSTTTVNWNTVHPVANFTIGRGYLYSVQATNPTKSFAGNLNSGTINYDLTLTADTNRLKGFNLVGNPYPSSIDWQATSGWTRTLLEISGTGKDMWVWNPSANNYGVCNSATGSSGTHDVTRYIAPMQGFFVRAASAGTLSLTNAIRVHDNTTFWKSAQFNPNAVSAVVTSESDKTFDEVRLLFGYPANQQGTAKLFSPVETAPSLYLPTGNGNYTIRYLTDTIATPAAPLQFKPGKTGNYSMSFNFDDTVFKTVFLEDRKEKALIDLRSNPVYRFNASTADNSCRFILHFTPVKGLPDDELPARISANGPYIQVDLRLITGMTTVAVYDLVGRKRLEQQLAGESQHTLNSIPGTQLLIIKLINPHGQLVRKILCNNTY